MFNLADIVVIVLILFAAFRGYKKGFIKTGFGMISFFLALAITFMFYKPVMNYLKDSTGIEEWLTEYLYSIDFGEVNNPESGEAIATTNDNDFLNNLPQVVVEMLDLEEVKENVKTTIVEKIVDFAMKLLAIIIVYISAKIILSIIVLVLNSIFTLPILKQFNELLGLLVGIALGFIHSYVLCAIVALISSMPVAEGVTSLVNTSLFAHVLYNNNLLLQILF